MARSLPHPVRTDNGSAAGESTHAPAHRAERCSASRRRRPAVRTDWRPVRRRRRRLGWRLGAPRRAPHGAAPRRSVSDARAARPGRRARSHPAPKRSRMASTACVASCQPGRLAARRRRRLAGPERRRSSAGGPVARAEAADAHARAGGRPAAMSSPARSARRHPGDLRARRRAASRSGARAGDRAEVAVAHLERDRPPGQPVAAQPAADRVGQPHQLPLAALPAR